MRGVCIYVAKMTTPSLEIVAGICIAVTGAVVTYTIKPRTSRVRLCCGIVECYRRVRRLNPPNSVNENIGSGDGGAGTGVGGAGGVGGGGGAGGAG
eukprot:6185192-Pleurochrysis_carterae.AAC.2